MRYLAMVPLFLAGMNWGVALAFPLGSYLIRPIPYAVTESGIRHGRAHLPWSLYSHYEYDPETGITRLFSVSSPALPNCVLMPPRESSLLVVDHVRRYLPSGHTGEVPWHRAPWALVAGMGLLASAFLLPGLLLISIPLAWLYYPLAFWLFQDWGMRLIHRFDPSGKPVRKDGHPTDDALRK